jgi:hypothetical protein
LQLPNSEALYATAVVPSLTLVEPVGHPVEDEPRHPRPSDLANGATAGGGRAVEQVVAAHEDHAPGRARPLHLLQQFLLPRGRPYCYVTLATLAKPRQGFFF